MELLYLLSQEIDINTKIINIYKNEDVQRILNSCSRSFQHNIPWEEVNSLKLIAIWLSIENWKNKSSFTTYLYSIFKNQLYKYKQPKFKTKNNWSRQEKESLRNVPKILNEYYIDNLTFQEIGDKYNKTSEWARKKFNKELQNTKKVYNIGG